MSTTTAPTPGDAVILSDRPDCAEVARFLRVHPFTVARWVRSGAVPTDQDATGRRWIPRTYLDGLINDAGGRPGEGLLTPEEFADLFQISIGVAGKWADQRHLPALRLPVSDRTRFLRGPALEAFGTPPPPAPDPAPGQVRLPTDTGPLVSTRLVADLWQVRRRTVDRQWVPRKLLTPLDLPWMSCLRFHREEVAHLLVRYPVPDGAVLLRRKDAATRQGVTLKVVNGWISSGRLPAVALPGGLVRVDARQLDRLDAVVPLSKDQVMGLLGVSRKAVDRLVDEGLLTPLPGSGRRIFDEHPVRELARRYAPPPGQALTSAEAAQVCGVDARTIGVWGRSGLLRRVPVLGGTVLYQRTSVERLDRYRRSVLAEPPHPFPGGAP